MSNQDDLRSYLESCRVSSNRTRSSLVVLVTASILIFAAFWNSYQRSWTNLRIERLSNAIALKAWDRFSRDSLVDVHLKKQFDLARDFMQVRGIADSSALAQLLTQYRSFQLNEIVNISVPVLGIHVDVNDLGLASGITFIALLIWLRFSLVRELQDLKIMVAKARKGNLLQDCYELWSMQQLFNIPKSEVKSRKKWERRTPQFLLFMPLAVQLTVLANDLNSLQYATSISSISTIIVVVLSLFALLIILPNTLACRKLVLEINQVWDQ